MARTTQTSKTRTGYGGVNTDGVQLVRAAQITPGFSESAANAQALADALGLAVDVGGKIMVQRNREGLAAGIRDAQLGKVDQQQFDEFEAYANGVQAVRAQAEFLDSQSELVDFLQKNFDRSSGTIDELNGLIDGFYKDRFGDETDVAKLSAWAPMMAETRASLVGKYQSELVAEQQNQIKRDLSTILVKSYENGLPDIDGVYQQAKVLLGPDEAGKLVANGVQNLMIDNGDVDLLDMLPERWSDGSMGIRNDPRYMDGFTSARANAQAQADRNAAELIRLEEKRRKEQQELTKTLLIDGVFQGTDMTVHIQEQLRNRTIDASDAVSLVNFNREYAKSLTEKAQAPDYDYISMVRYEVEQGKHDLDSLMMALVDTKAGSGEPRLSVMKDLTSLLRTVEKQSLSEQSDPQYAEVMRQVDKVYRTEDPVLGGLGVEAVTANQTARRLARKFIEEAKASGTNYDQSLIMERVLREVPLKANITGATLSVGQVTKVGGDTRTVIKQALSNRPEAIQVLRLRYRGGEIKLEEIKTMKDSGELTEEQAKQLLQSLKN